MKYALLGLVPFFFLITSCQQVRDLAGKFKKSAPSASTGTTLELSGDEYAAFIAQKDKLVVVDFHATWCGPCKQLAPILESVAAEHGDLVIVGKLDVDRASEVASSAGVRALPDVRFYRDGKQVDNFMGLIPEDVLRQKFQIHTQGLNAVADGEAPAAPTVEPTIQPMKSDWLPPGMERR